MTAPDDQRKFLRIVYVGPQGHGTNAGALARAFRRQGHLVHVIDPEVFLPTWRSGGVAVKALGRAIRPIGISEFNKRIVIDCAALQPDLFFVFKGPMLTPETLQTAKAGGAYAALFYPDVSLYAHGDLIPCCLPLYDHIFTTKTFGISDLAQIGITCAEFLPHGFDPDLHREFPDVGSGIDHLRCDASFIGTWSPKKEAILATVKQLLPDIHLTIWGNQWEKIRQTILKPSIVGSGIDGDAYALAIQASKVNIAILSEVRQGASSGDQITSRTFHIPASGGFMLHERTAEFLQFYREGEEAACFEDAEELAEKIRFYLDHPDERERVRRNGHARCVAENSMDERARTIIARLQEKRWHRRQS